MMYINEDYAVRYRPKYDSYILYFDTHRTSAAGKKILKFLGDYPSLQQAIRAYASRCVGMCFYDQDIDLDTLMHDIERIRADISEADRQLTMLFKEERGIEAVPAKDEEMFDEDSEEYDEAEDDGE